MLPGEQNAPFQKQNAPLGEQNAPLGAFCYAFCYARSILLPGEHFAMEHFAPWGAKCYAIAKCLEQNAPPAEHFAIGRSKMLPWEQFAPRGAFCYEAKCSLSRAKCSLSRAKCSPWGAKCSQKDCRMTTTDSGARCALK